MNKPAFLLLANSPFKDKYFARTCQWRVHDKDHIAVIDKYQPRVITMDPWPQVIYLEATGYRTVSQFVDYMAKGYTSEIPPELDQVILEEIKELVKEKLIELSDEPIGSCPTCGRATRVAVSRRDVVSSRRRRRPKARPGLDISGPARGHARSRRSRQNRPDWVHIALRSGLTRTDIDNRRRKASGCKRETAK